MLQVSVESLEYEVELSTTLRQAGVTVHRVEVSRSLASLSFIQYLVYLLLKCWILRKARLFAGTVPLTKCCDSVEVEIELVCHALLSRALQISQVLVLVVLRSLTLCTRLFKLPLHTSDVRAEHFGLGIDYLIRASVHLERVRPVVQLWVVVD